MVSQVQAPRTNQLQGGNRGNAARNPRNVGHFAQNRGVRPHSQGAMQSQNSAASNQEAHFDESATNDDSMISKDKIGQILSAISNSGIKYTGRIKSMNHENFTLVLENVKCHGTEDRVKDPTFYVPPNPQIYPQIEFSASNISHCALLADESAYNLYSDPAIISVTAASSATARQSKVSHIQSAPKQQRAPSENNENNNQRSVKLQVPAEKPSASQKSNGRRVNKEIANGEADNENQYVARQFQNRQRNQRRAQNFRKNRPPMEKIDPKKAEEHKQDLQLDINATDRLEELNTPNNTIDATNGPVTCYDSALSFFDTLSSEKDTKIAANNYAGLKTLNIETFGKEFRAQQKFFPRQRRRFNRHNNNAASSPSADFGHQKSVAFQKRHAAKTDEAEKENVGVVKDTVPVAQAS